MKPQGLAIQASTLISLLFITALVTLLAACSSGSSSSNDDDDASAGTIELQLRVLSHQGARLAGATVSAGGETATSDSEGALSLEVDSAEEVVATASLSGYITQSVLLSAEADGDAQIRLMPVKDAFDVGDIGAPRTLTTRELGGRLTFPADAFVTPAGAQASGPATISITPWDISADDLTAMPGDSQALDASGERVQLISAGMMTVQVHNAVGEPLQLAPGVEAVLQLDLPIANINEQVLQVGDTIPMWHFDEGEGLWIEDDSVLGQVVASATSPVGLAVTASVPHFSTWNWDFKFEGGGSIDVQCVLASNQDPVSCAVTATINLPGGSAITRSTTIPAGGTTIINMPSDATIVWQASGAGGLLGETSSTLSGGSGAGVIIELQPPTTEHDVQCLMPDNTPVPCDVTLSDATNTLSQSITAAPTNIVTLWQSPGPIINWAAELAEPILYSGQMVLAEGTATSGTTGTVLISLASLTPVDEVTVQCVSALNTALPCNLSAEATVAGGPNVTETETLPVAGGTVTLPSATTLIDWAADTNGNAYAQNGQFIVFTGTATTALTPSVTLVLDNENIQGPAAQTIEVRCINSGSTSASTCDIEVYREGTGVGFVLLDSFPGAAVGAYQVVNLPNGIAEGDEIVLMATGDDTSTASSSEAYNGMTDGDQFSLQLN